MAALSGVNGSSPAPRGLLRRGRAAWAAADASLVVIFAVAFLSSLSGFMWGSALGLHSQLHAPAVDELGLRHKDTSITEALEDRALRQAALREAQEGLGPEDPCHTEEHAEFGGDFVVKWGEGHLKDTAAECCAACSNYMKCNVWVWCADPGGCEDGRKHKECWLKQQKSFNPAHITGIRGPSVKWTSGARFTNEEALRQVAADYERRLRLRANASLPLVYLDVGIKGKYVGRIEIVLFTHISPRAAENYRQLCTGEHGIAKPGHEGAGRPYHFKGRPFYRIIDGFIDQSGVDVDSVFGGEFKDDAAGLRLKHDRIGLLSMANAGPNTNTAHFSIMLGPASHLDGSYTIFGEVVTGLKVVKAVNALAKGKPDNTANADDGAFIIDSGQLRRGAPVTQEMLAA
ncbi:peptidylprolyl isomerase D (cyclophilin D) [Monoraphidium neglectum]|uniref:Peptidylprolyl isomerase D (Cyclophilin D) n=1 Tax=Monoraphidium neglectum TaxID=145388 RepID=A0A0D2LGW3_9CHLO|nr:peptidylprolyl isomerase D (cyclophilin D) [Monoraphidium neglectum]KIZ05729.1 peptidylprolyl isomerase D (cyclophilin D) [Monoraphidium neglectum]|eukprot:XP_013904748.1 peptidylprolyl isomerase D (cyclophilin D) [Monoraphidium neglectum]